MSKRVNRGWVADASIAVKWFVPEEVEPDAERARELMGAFPLRTTSLAFYEAGNAFAVKGRMNPQEVRECLATIAATCGEPVEMTDDDFDSAARIAVRHGITFYDASYAAIADRLNRKVISADSDLLEPGLAVTLDEALSG